MCAYVPCAAAQEKRYSKYKIMYSISTWNECTVNKLLSVHAHCLVILQQNGYDNNIFYTCMWDILFFKIKVQVHDFATPPPLPSVSPAASSSCTPLASMLPPGMYEVNKN